MAYSPIGADENGNLPPDVKGRLDTHYAPIWQPSTAYATNAPVVLPNGTLGTRTVAGTSRSTFDATELALWTVTSGGSGGAGLTDDGDGLFTISSGSSITEDPSNTGLYLIGA